MSLVCLPWTVDGHHIGEGVDGGDQAHDGDCLVGEVDVGSACQFAVRALAVRLFAKQFSGPGDGSVGCVLMSCHGEIETEREDGVGHLEIVSDFPLPHVAEHAQGVECIAVRVRGPRDGARGTGGRVAGARAREWRGVLDGVLVG